MPSDAGATSRIVQQNLVHYNLWSDVRFHDVDCAGGVTSILSGRPPTKLVALDNVDVEWVIPRLITHNRDLDVGTISSWFDRIATLPHQKRPQRITLGLLNDDGTVVYYFIHDGIVKPRQN
ncbi:uncharacterized protein PRCAT00000647001 [Priceomyces carsonii]|uniref:uncharacterized protein n=1 Tax=Priceomyces carsonii TaxID=28549 RepID=UPI002ED91816|nr:unnamed protein product [Priceomyces carsonii]